jgi:ubiquinone/menaquinone biosynthesis C-methylase UbiE
VGVAEYDAVADAYSRVIDPQGAGLEDPSFEELLGNLAGQYVLSLACGQGQDARLLARLGATVVGVDLSERMLDRARLHERARPRGITYLQGDAQDLAGFDSSVFDGVSCHMALMDMPDLAQAIVSVARVLKPGGWFVYSIVHPCYPGHVATVSDYLDDVRYAKPQPVDWLPVHAHHRPLSTHVNELAAAGFRIERMLEGHHNPADAGGVPGLLYVRAVLD